MADGTANKDKAGKGVDPNVGSQAQKQQVPHVDALKASISVSLKLDLSDLASVPTAQKVIKDVEELLRKAGAHVACEISLGRVKETLFK